MEVVNLSLAEAGGRVIELREHVAVLQAFAQKVDVYMSHAEQFYARHSAVDPLTVGAELESCANDLESEFNELLSLHDVQLVRLFGLAQQLRPLAYHSLHDVESKQARARLLEYQRTGAKLERIKEKYAQVLAELEATMRALRLQLQRFRCGLGGESPEHDLASLLHERSAPRAATPASSRGLGGRAPRVMVSSGARVARAKAAGLGQSVARWVQAARGNEQAAAARAHNGGPSAASEGLGARGDALGARARSATDGDVAARAPWIAAPHPDYDRQPWLPAALARPSTAREARLVEGSPTGDLLQGHTTFVPASPHPQPRLAGSSHDARASSPARGPRETAQLMGSERDNHANMTALTALAPDAHPVPSVRALASDAHVLQSASASHPPSRQQQHQHQHQHQQQQQQVQQQQLLPQPQPEQLSNPRDAALASRVAELEAARQANRARFIPLAPAVPPPDAPIPLQPRSNSPAQPSLPAHTPGPTRAGLANEEHKREPQAERVHASAPAPSLAKLSSRAQTALAELEAATALQTAREMAAFRARQGPRAQQPSDDEPSHPASAAAAAPSGPSVAAPRSSPPRLFTVDERLVPYEHGVPGGFADAYDNVYKLLPDVGWRDSFIRVSVPVSATMLPLSMRQRASLARTRTADAGASASTGDAVSINAYVARDGSATYNLGVRPSGADRELSLREQTLLAERRDRKPETQSRISEDALDRATRMRFELQALHQGRNVKQPHLRPGDSPFPNY